MASVRIRARVRGDDHALRALARRLREVERGDLQRELTSAVRRAAVPMVTAVRGAAAALPAETGQSTGLRVAIAGASRFANTAANGVSVIVDPARMPHGQKALPYHTDRGSWRHPTFGRDPWVTQVSAPNWFYAACETQSGRVRNEVVAAADRVWSRL